MPVAAILTGGYQRVFQTLIKAGVLCYIFYFVLVIVDMDFWAYWEALELVFIALNFAMITLTHTIGKDLFHHRKRMSAYSRRVSATNVSDVY